MKNATRKRSTAPAEPQPSAPAGSVPAEQPHFGEPATTPDPLKFRTKHDAAGDKAAYAILDKEEGKLQPTAFPAVPGPDEPVLALSDVYGANGPDLMKVIQGYGQIVFHSLGDTGNTKGPKDQNEVVDKLASDFEENQPADLPAFLYHLGDVVYSFGEAAYYYDQFYDAYRDYPAPILAIPGNHDGMVAPGTSAQPLTAFLANFCTAGQRLHTTQEAGGLVRTAQIQPGVYFTLEAPFVRILGLYSNVLEDPGIISSEDGTYKDLTDVQLAYLQAALTRIKKQNFAGAVIIAVHHPPYVATTKPKKAKGKHGGSGGMLSEIDAICAKTGIWPHAVLSGHAHNYQRFTRAFGGRQTPFIVCGNGGHAVSKLTRKSTPPLRTPADQPLLSNGSDSIRFERYDDQDFGYLRIVVSAKQLRIEYHPASDGASAKTPDDSVSVDLATRTLVA
ncbi:MAG TPA: metallophosphoesterase [Bryobacteraceae bacterium]|nr:metallophosphoesterase [Bryobacteraceae bacterium]